MYNDTIRGHTLSELIVCHASCVWIIIRQHRNVFQLVIMSLNCFGGGVILTTCFTHMLPEVTDPHIAITGLLWEGGGLEIPHATSCDNPVIGNRTIITIVKHQ